MQGHLRAGKQAVRLAVEWNQRLSCVLGDDLIIRRLRFADVLQEEAANSGEDAAALFDADFALMSLELAAFLPNLLEVFGGEEQGLEKAA
jgi:recombination associated protein RdgC